MTKCERSGILSKAEKQRLESRGVILECRRCNKAIEIDDPFIRKRRSGRIILSGGKASHVDYYHKKCWKAMFI